MREISVKERDDSSINESTKGNIRYYYLNENEYIDSLFNRIPSNANINKGRCGIGGTTLELKDTRNSIVVVPNISTIESKKNVFPNLFCVFGNIDVAKLESYILDCLYLGKFIKIMSTPDSLWKIEKAANKLGYNIQQDCFILLDESHALITEGTYRKEISKPLDYFFSFKEKALISATPYEFSDSRICELEQHVIVIPNEPNKVVNIINTQDVFASLKSLAQHPDHNNIHVFYNSVNGAKEYSSISEDSHEISICCAETEENRVKLAECSELIKNPCFQKPTKLNFYTSKYFEGWDLYDYEPTIVLISDVFREHTCIGIENKAIQAIGRLRSGEPKYIYHITNSKNIEMVQKSKTEIREEVREEANVFIDYFNNSYDKLNFKKSYLDKLVPVLKPLVEPYGDLDSSETACSVNYCKIDTQVNLRYNMEQYFNIATICSAWKNTVFNYTVTSDNNVLDYKDYKFLVKSRASQADKNKKIIVKYNNSILDFKSGKYLFAENPLAEFKLKYPDLYKYYNCLGFEKLNELGFKSNLMKKEYYVQTATSIDVTLSIQKILDSQLVTNRFYTNDYLKTVISDIYNLVDNGKVGKASHITNFYKVRITTKEIDQKIVGGYILLHKLF